MPLGDHAEQPWGDGSPIERPADELQRARRPGGIRRGRLETYTRIDGHGGACVQNSVTVSERTLSKVGSTAEHSEGDTGHRPAHHRPRDCGRNIRRPHNIGQILARDGSLCRHGARMPSGATWRRPSGCGSWPRNTCYCKNLEEARERPSEFNARMRLRHISQVVVCHRWKYRV
ncbi:hypothetical protein BD413DRAFT_585837 [Trametes elegans]|nr:hypothetical protein BD413DRAFT_585837 [Trametes elegans]